MVSSEPLPRLGRRTAGAALILMAGFIASRLTGLLREAAIGYQFGTSRDYDLYLAAIRIPDTLFQVIAGGAVAAAFIPVFARHRAISESQGWRLVCTLIHLAVLIFAPLTAVLIALAPVEKSGEFFGLYSLSGRSASVAGLTVWYAVAALTRPHLGQLASLQAAAGAMLALVVLGGLLALPLPDRRPTRDNCICT